jgi:hypothetical protein
MADPHELRDNRLVAVTRRVPEFAKAWPKRVQSRRLTRLARRYRRGVSPSDAVLVVGTARSGSTWLFEMLASDPQFLPLFEPFHPRNNPRFRRFADPIGQFAPPGRGTGAAAADDLARLVSEVCAGRELTTWSTRRMPRSRLQTAPRTLVKDVSVTRGLWWMVRAVPVPVVLLVRHPCAVVESMLRTGWAWQDWTRDDVEAALTITLCDVFDRELPAARLPGDRPRLLAAWWAVSTLAALAALAGRQGGWVVAFEDLVVDPPAEMHAFSGPLGFDDLLIDAARPSFMTSRSSPLRGGASPLDSWRERLSPHDTAAVLETAHSFGATFYTEAIHPDRDAMPPMAGATGGVAHRSVGHGRPRW